MNNQKCEQIQKFEHLRKNLFTFPKIFNKLYIKNANILKISLKIFYFTKNFFKKNILINLYEE